MNKYILEKPPIVSYPLYLRFPQQFCYLGRVAHLVGWKYKHVLERMERRRYLKKKINVNHEIRVKAFKKKAIGFAHKDLAQFNKVKAQYGFK